MSTTAPQRPEIGQSLLRMVIGAALGGGALWLYWTYSHEIRWSDGVAIAVALICFIAAMRLFTESFNPKQLAKRLEVEDDTTPKEASAARLQAVLMLVLGVAMLWPVVATLQHWPAPLWAYAVIAIFIIIRIGYTLAMWTKADEFVRQRTKNVTWWTYFWSQTALIAYACAERLGLVSALTAWDIMVLITATSIATAAFVGRGKTAA